MCVRLIVSQYEKRSTILVIKRARKGHRYATILIYGLDRKRPTSGLAFYGLALLRHLALIVVDACNGKERTKPERTNHTSDTTLCASHDWFCRNDCPTHFLMKHLTVPVNWRGSQLPTVTSCGELCPQCAMSEVACQFAEDSNAKA